MQMPGGRPLEPSQSKILFGIGGTLRFVCIFMVFLVPFFTVYDYYRSLPSMDLNFFTVIGLGQDLVITVFSVIAGALLMKMKRIGLMLARAFMIARAAFALLYIVLDVLLSVYLNTSDTTTLTESIVGQFGKGIIFPLLLLLYLFTSQRVKNTYPKPDPAMTYKSDADGGGQPGPLS
jgi:hypothetical protein